MELRIVGSLLALFGLWLSPPQDTAAKVASPLARVAVAGASVSAGYGIGQPPLGGAVTLADIVHASIAVEHDPPRNLASTFAFLNSSGYMENTVAVLAKDPPSALIAIDYLFWTVHGDKSDTERRKQLESGLAGLEKLSCPILLGDIPDVAHATAGDSPVLMPAMAPSAAVRETANARIRDWAKLHGNVTIIPIADLMKKLNDGSEIQLRGNSWTGLELDGLLQKDHLHATAEGLVAIWIATADSWLRKDSKLPANALELRAKTLVDAANLKIRK